MQTSDLPLLDRYPDLALLLDEGGRPLYLNPSAKGLQQRLGGSLDLAPGQPQATFEVTGVPNLTFTLHWSRVDWEGAPAWMVFARRDAGGSQELRSRVDELEAELARVRSQTVNVTPASEVRQALVELELQETQRLFVDGLTAGDPPASWVQELEAITRSEPEAAASRMLELVDRNLKLAGLTAYYQARIRQFEHWQRDTREKLERSDRKIAELEQQLTSQPATVDPHTQRLAYEDALTNTPNTNVLLPYLEQMAESVERGDCSVALLLVAIDSLDTVTRTLGLEARDSLVRQCGQRIRAAMRNEDVLGRIRGGEFAIVVRLPVGGPEGQHPLSQLSAMLSQKIQAALAEPIQLERQSVETSASVGIVVLSGAASSALLLEQARFCVQQARKGGKGRHHFFSAELQQRHAKDGSLLRQLEGALDRDEFTLRFQPVVDLKSGKIVAAEALLRWAHPSLGLLEPSHFLELADNAGFLLTVEEWAVREACAQILALGRGLTAMINVSPRQTVQADLTRRLMKAWEKSKMRAENLVVEIPETILLSDPERTEKLGRELTRCRVQVAIDSYGADFASLRRIKRMGAAYLKLCPSLIAKLPSQDDGFRLCRAAVLGAQSLGIPTIAKAVERKEQAASLKAMGCQFGQGNYFAPPVTSNDFQQLLKKTWKV